MRLSCIARIHDVPETLAISMIRAKKTKALQQKQGTLRVHMLKYKSLALPFKPTTDRVMRAFRLALPNSSRT